MSMSELVRYFYRHDEGKKSMKKWTMKMIIAAPVGEIFSHHNLQWLCSTHAFSLKDYRTRVGLR